MVQETGRPSRRRKCTLPEASPAMMVRSLGEKLSQLTSSRGNPSGTSGPLHQSIASRLAHMLQK